MMSMTQRQKTDQSKAWKPNTPGAQVAENDIQLQPPTPENNTQGLGEQMHSNNEATQMCPQRHASSTSKYQFFERQYHAHSFRRSRILRLGLAQMETPDKTKTNFNSS